MPRGGTQPGAGRPHGTGKYGEPTKIMRVPISQHAEVLRLIAGQSLTLPLYACSVSAGFPSPADDYVAANINLVDHLITNPPATFCVRVAGESMRDAGIFDGDVLVVDSSITAIHGHTVVAEVDGEFTVKRYCLKDNEAWLMPANSEYNPVHVDLREVRIVGVVTWRLGKLT